MFLIIQFNRLSYFPIPSIIDLSLSAIVLSIGWPCANAFLRSEILPFVLPSSKLFFVISDVIILFVFVS